MAPYPFSQPWLRDLSYSVSDSAFPKDFRTARQWQISVWLSYFQTDLIFLCYSQNSNKKKTQPKPMLIAEQTSSNFQPQFSCVNNCSKSSWKVILEFYLCLIVTGDHFLFQLEVPPAPSVWFRFIHCPAGVERKKQFHLKTKQGLRGIWWFIFMGEKLVFPVPCISVWLVGRAGLSSVPCPQCSGGKYGLSDIFG